MDKQHKPHCVHCFYLATDHADACLWSEALVAQELEALGLAIMISLAMLASEILILGVYLSALRRRTSRQKLGPYLMILYLLICCSTAEERSDFDMPPASPRMMLSSQVEILSDSRGRYTSCRHHDLNLRPSSFGLILCVCAHQ